jgi:hypothetical protein
MLIVKSNIGTCNHHCKLCAILVAIDLLNCTFTQKLMQLTCSIIHVLKHHCNRTPWSLSWSWPWSMLIISICLQNCSSEHHNGWTCPYATNAIIIVVDWDSHVLCCLWQHSDCLSNIGHWISSNTLTWSNITFWSAACDRLEETLVDGSIGQRITMIGETVFAGLL